jgi:guanidinopropionase
MSEESHPHPPSGLLRPRFWGVASFMRLPLWEEGDSPPEIGIFGVPFDSGTTFRPGARFGPRALREASTLMRHYHPVLGFSPYERTEVKDCGDVPVNPLDIAVTLDHIRDFVASLQALGITPLAAGGDHLVSLALLRGLRERAPFALVHFDAHSDTTDQYFGGSRLAHGTPFRRAVEEGLLDPRRIVQIGIRGSLNAPDELAWAEAQGLSLLRIEEALALGAEEVGRRVREVVGEGPVYLSFDIDCLDPAFAPGTGTPEIGGFSTREAQSLLRALRGLDFIGADLVEVAPPYDVGGITALAGASLMWEILCLLAEAVTARRTAAKEGGAE